MKSLYVFIREERLLFFFATVASLLLSTWGDYRETVINPDAICYLLSAEHIASSGVRGAMQLCGQAQWPFYSVFIYALTQLTHHSVLISAYLLNGCFSLLSVLTFIFIVKELGGCKRTLWLAAGVILLAHQFNVLRVSIVRDHGSWAFYLVSDFFLLRFFRHPRYITAFAFSFSLFLAALFRIENFIFLIILPFLSWMLTQYAFRERLQYFLMLATLPIVLCVIGGSYLLFHPHAIATLGRIADLAYQWQHGVMAMIERFSTMKMALAQHVLSADSINDAGLVLILTLVAWYIISIMSNVSWIYALLVVYAWRNKVVTFARSASLVLWGHIGTNLVITFLFLLERNFLSNRYLLALSLILMIWVPFALNDLLNKWQIVSHRILLGLAVLFISISSLGGIFDFGYSKAYIHQAGDWLAANVPYSANLYVNDYQVMYYSKHFGNRIFELSQQSPQLKQYDYLALRLKGKEKREDIIIWQKIKLSSIKVFRNKRNDRVEIYKVMRTTQ